MSDKTQAIALVESLVAASSCYEGLRELGNKWLKAVGTPEEKEYTNKLMEALEEDVMPITSSIEFFSTEEAKKMLGEETAAKLLKDFTAAKEQGEQYCLCPACSAGRKILESRDLFA